MKTRRTLLIAGVLSLLIVGALLFWFSGEAPDALAVREGPEDRAASETTGPSTDRDRETERTRFTRMLRSLKSRPKRLKEVREQLRKIQATGMTAHPEDVEAAAESEKDTDTRARKTCFTPEKIEKLRRIRDRIREISGKVKVPAELDE